MQRLPESGGVGKAGVRNSFFGLAGLCLAACAGPVYPVHPIDTNPTVTVRPGDTYFALARRYAVSVDELITWNRAEPPFTLYPGDVLVLPKPIKHKVRYGETLYAIADRYKVDHDRLARVNSLRHPGFLVPGTELDIPRTGERTDLPSVRKENGQIVALPAPAPDVAHPVARPQRTARGRGPARWTGAPAPAVKRKAVAYSSKRMASVPRLNLMWPVDGKVISPYGSNRRGVVNDGINIAVPQGTPVRAAATGIVIYKGNLVPGFGKLILVQHDRDHVTAYGHLSRYEVNEGERVIGGQTIGRSGSTGNVDAPQLHFEVRRGVKPVNPMPYLGARS